MKQKEILQQGIVSLPNGEFLKIYKACNEVFKRLNNLRRWTDINSEARYNELAKQALNSIVAFLIVSQLKEIKENVDDEKIVRIAIFRAFQKAYVLFDTPEHKMQEICRIAKMSDDILNVVTVGFIAELTNENFAEFLYEPIKKKSKEYQIFRVATKVATNVELYSLKKRDPSLDNFEKVQRKEENLKKELEKLKAILPKNFSLNAFVDADSKIFKLIYTLTSLRNQNRWSVMSCASECSVLGHLFDTAVLAYFQASELDYPDELKAKFFWMGIFHDVAETWTKDIPSPIKDRIPGFREATEKFELMKIQENIYDKIPEYIADDIKSVMMEEDANQKYKKLLKGADYLSADMECWRQYEAGSGDNYFAGSMGRFNFKVAELAPAAYAFHNFLIMDVEFRGFDTTNPKEEKIMTTSSKQEFIKCMDNAMGNTVVKVRVSGADVRAAFLKYMNEALSDVKPVKVKKKKKKKKKNKKSKK